MTATHEIRKAPACFVSKCARKGCRRKATFVEHYQSDDMPKPVMVPLCERHAYVLSAGAHITIKGNQ